MKGWSQVHTADNPTEIGFVRGLLEAQGIQTRVRSMELWAAAVEIYFAEGARPSVWVPDGQLDWARQVLEQRSNPPESPAWNCPRCGEQHDGQFTACWRCASALDSD